ncbi:Maf family protein [Algicella marina]|uniref:Nucleoside triphosphate pyrophosphatase n=1 Tax=Algicella marina TaxID=2683284 RepID=A0A6P1T535_9RHOB|nr:Maf family protein [Algicella marina]QHQ36596.1 septum formation protein Maf [Algicella marina]
MTEPRRLILASASPIRATMLRQCGVEPEIVPARVDEAALKAGMVAESAKPRDIADALAEMKARKISQKHPEAVVIGADQVLVQGDRLFDKAETIQEAAEILRTLRNSAHTLLSAAVAYEGGEPVWRHIGQVQLVMRDFSDDFLADYITRHGDGLLATVGCYKLEEDGPALFSRVQGDYFTILGLPLLEVLAFLRTRRIATS